MLDIPAPVTVQEALRKSGRSIEVPDNETVWVGPFDSFADTYRIAEVVRFEELQELRLLPSGFAEKQAFDALMADDSAFRDARKNAGTGRHRCSCEDASHPAESRSRGRQHANLKSLLRLSYRRSQTADDPGVQHIYVHLKRWFSKPARYLLGVTSTQNIIVGANGTLVMSPTVHVVNADLIELGAGSRLRFESGMVDVMCETLNGPIPPPRPQPDPPIRPPEGPPLPDPPPRFNPTGRYLRGYAREFEIRKSTRDY